MTGPGRIYFKQSTVRKNVGARHLEKNWRFLVITVGVSAVSSPEKLSTFFWS